MGIGYEQQFALLGTGISGGTIYAASYFQYLERKRQRKNRPLEELTLEERITRLAELMKQSSATVAQIEDELKARRATAEQLRHEAETSERLAGINAEAREAVAALVRSEVQSEGKRSLLATVAISTAYFLGGVAATIAVTLFIHPIK